jgi:hypothetical protein
MTAPRPYQVCLYVGPSAPVLADVRVVDLTPADDTPAAVLARLRESALNPADLRSRVLFVADGDASYRDRTLMVYAALLGFARRRLDVAFGVDAEALVMADFDVALRKTADAGRPETAIAQVQVGGPVRTDLPYVDISDGFTPAKTSLLRYARRLRFVPAPVLGHALPQLVAIAALRARGESDKLPYLCTGSEPVPTEDTVADVVGVCLDTLRREGEDVRRSLRSENRDSIAAKAEPTLRAQRLVDADAVPVRDTLVRLGGRSKVVEVAAKPGTPEHEAGQTVPLEVWHCPRPDRHTNGDATPSARITVTGAQGEGAFQCYKCDRERTGSLRLVMDVRGCTVDEAADWLLAS